MREGVVTEYACANKNPGLKTTIFRPGFLSMTRKVFFQVHDRGRAELTRRKEAHQV